MNCTKSEFIFREFNLRNKSIFQKVFTPNHNDDETVLKEERAQKDKEPDVCTLLKYPPKTGFC